VAQLPTNNQLIIARNSAPAKTLQELIAWVKQNGDKVTAGTRRSRQPLAHRRRLLPEHDRRPLPAGAVSRHPAGDPGPGGRADRHRVRPGVEFAAAGAQRRHQGLRRHGQSAVGRRSRHSERRRGRPAGFYTSFWFGLWVPKGTPSSVVNKLNAAVVDTLADPTVRARLGDLGSVIPPREQQTPEALAALHKAEIEKWWPIIKAANIKGE